MRSPSDLAGGGSREEADRLCGGKRCERAVEGVFRRRGGSSGHLTLCPRPHDQTDGPGVTTSSMDSQLAVKPLRSRRQRTFPRRSAPVCADAGLLGGKPYRKRLSLLPTRFCGFSVPAQTASSLGERVQRDSCALLGLAGRAEIATAPRSVTAFH